ncbi:hypothetical protein NIHE120848_49910 [Klebsiella pneumoniae]|nr:hypothetical protein NIHE120848_49910 [Klebsiella pneumoniae]
MAGVAGVAGVAGGASFSGIKIYCNTWSDAEWARGFSSDGSIQKAFVMQPR